MPVLKGFRTLLDAYEVIRNGTMIRKSYIDKYEEILIVAYKELIKKCQLSMFHSGDLLLCQQNGNILHGHTCIGPGNEGLNSFQQMNSLINEGLRYTTTDNDFPANVNFRITA